MGSSLRFASVTGIGIGVAFVVGSSSLGCAVGAGETADRRTLAGSGGDQNTAGGAPTNGAAGQSDASGGASTGGSSSGSGGTTASGGAWGTGGTITGTGGTTTSGTCASTAHATGTPGLIDDFEGAVLSAIPANDGRVGGWWLSAGPGSTTTPAANALPTSATGGNPGKAVHVSGTAAGWGLGLSVALAPTGSCYDASAYANGVKADMKGTGSVWITVLTEPVAALPEGQRNHYKKQIALSASWTSVTAGFSELTQPGGWGGVVPFDATEIIGVEFDVLEPGNVDFWVDNLTLY
jgi:hypothetical protein